MTVFVIMLHTYCIDRNIRYVALYSMM